MDRQTDRNDVDCRYELICVNSASKTPDYTGLATDFRSAAIEYVIKQTRLSQTLHYLHALKTADKILRIQETLAISGVFCDDAPLQIQS